MSVNLKTPKREHVYLFVYMYMYVSFIIRKALIHLDRRLTADCHPDQLPLPFLEAVPVDT